MERKIEVNAEKCIHCGSCIKDCLFNCIEFDENKVPRYRSGGNESCIACQHCMAICPVGALSFGGKNPDDSTAIDIGNPEELLNLIKSRRSYRQYKAESIPEEKLTKIKEMIHYAPTGGNVNDLHFSIVETKEKMDEIIKTTYSELERLNDTQPLIQMCVNSYKNGTDIIYRGATSLVAVATDLGKAVSGCESTDSIIALSYLELYAQSIGLGTLWCDMALMAAAQSRQIYSMLEIPENYTLNYILLMGIPSVNYKRTIQPEHFNIKEIK